MHTKFLKDPIYKRLACITLFCIVICALISINLLLHGPRIRKVEFDASKVTREMNQTVVLRSNQPLKQVDASQVSIEPSTNYTVTTSGQAVIIQLKQRLQYNTDYKITISDLESQRAKKSNFTSHIQTGGNEYFYLKRNVTFAGNKILSSKQDDQIMQASIDDPQPIAVFTAYKIEDYILVNDSLVINTINEKKETELIIFKLDTKERRTVKLPNSGTSISRLRSSPNAALFGFALTSDGNRTSGYDNTLFIYDLEANILVPMKGVEGKSISVAEWRFMPDGTSIIAQTFDTGVTLIDSTSQHQPIPIGNFSDIGNFSFDGSKAILDDYYQGPLIFNIQDKTKQPLQTKLIDGKQPISYKAVYLSNSDTLLRRLQIANEGTDTYTAAVAIEEANAYQIIYKVDSELAEIDAFSNSPNDQYLAIERYEMTEVPKYDGYDENSKPFNIKTLLVDISTKATVREIDGFNIIWR